MSHATPRTEQRRFQMHPDLLYSVIQKQAGTLTKALAELAQNAVDAAATKLNIQLTRHRFSVADDGRGITERDTLVQFWETFGTPHTEGDAVFGQFRIGRGQIMAFASTLWRTGPFEMLVDIKRKGLEYQLADGLVAAEGCHIEGDLYDPLAPSELDNTVTELRQALKYFPIPLFVNGTQINTLPQDEKWDHESESLRFRPTGTGGLRVYNLGAFVRTYPDHLCGTSGIAVSKVPMKVNFARNDVIQSQCAVFKEIRKVASSHSTTAAVKNVRLTDAQRTNFALGLIHGELSVRPESARKLALITDVAGIHRPLKAMLDFNGCITVAPRDQRTLGERIHRDKLAFVLSESTLERFGVATVAELLERVRVALGACWKPDHQRTDESIAAYTGMYDGGYVAVPPHEVTKKERAALAAIEDATRYIMSHRTAEATGEGRRLDRALRLGASDLAEAWTDGTSTVTLERKVVAELDRGIKGAVRVMLVMAHEYCHDDPSNRTHDHDESFFERFHDAVTDTHVIGDCAVACVKAYIRALRREKIALPAALRRLEDADAAAADDDAHRIAPGANAMALQ